MLSPDESLHCVRVLRHREGDIISVIDGMGSCFECRIVQADPRCVMTEIVSQKLIPNHWGANFTLAVAPTKNMDRMEWMVEKAVEIGVDRIVPLLCEHSERKVLKAERLRKIAVSAMKQSLKTTLPHIDELIPIGDFIISEALCRNPGSSANTSPLLFMGYCDSAYPRLELAKEYIPGRNAVIMIGPEGDFSPAEVKMAVEAGFSPATFGMSRLRTETAAIVALDTLHIVSSLGDSLPLRS